jgi:hypothetical protein
VSSGVSACGFAAAEVFAGHAELAPWLCLSPRRCRVRASGLAGSRTGRSPAGVAGAGGVLDAGAREPMIVACGERVPCWSGLACVRLSSPHGRPAAGQPAGCVHPFVCPRVSPGGMGRVRAGPGGVNHRGARAAAGRGAE